MQVKFIKLLNNLFRVGSKLKKMLAYSVIYGHFSLFVTKNVKKSKKLLKIVNIDWENFHIFLRT